MAYLDDDFIDDEAFIDLPDEDLDLVFRVTDDGEVWDEAEESYSDNSDEDWDGYFIDELDSAYDDLADMGYLE